MTARVAFRWVTGWVLVRLADLLDRLPSRTWSE